MGKKLVIVESPAKAKTINKYLGSDYEVVASYGHVRDLVPKEGAVDPDQDFAMAYQVIERNQKHVDRIAKSLKKADALYLATDPDREGEAIAWHLVEVLRGMGALDDKPVYRVVFHEITERAVQEALEHPREISSELVNAQQARRALDYLVGFNLSPLLWKKIRRGLSAGRVQSPALRMIVEREEEIENFEPREYWSVEAEVAKDSQTFNARLVRLNGEKDQKFTIDSEKKAEDARRTLEIAAGGDARGAPAEGPVGRLRVAGVERKQRRRNPAAPFITSTLQQEASRKLSFSTRRTMTVAQQLYEGVDIGGETVGLITYMRTDSVNLAGEAIGQIRDLIADRFGNENLPDKPRQYRTRSKNAQEAHEAIRPTSVRRDPETVRQYLGQDQARLYELIWKRAVASQMIHATYDTVAVNLEANKDNVFRATGSTLVHPGFIAVYQEGRDEQAADKTRDEDEERELPPLSEGEVLALNRIITEQHFTEPPPRYTEASLVRALEEQGIGRPSTYAQIISTLLQREYAELDNRRFRPTDVGRLVNRFLTEHFTPYVDYEFTSELEDDLDAVSRGERDWVPLMREFWEPFHERVQEKEKIPREEVQQARTLGTDPESGKPVSVRMGRYGPFVQIGTHDDDEKPRFAGLKPGQKMDTITLEEALKLFNLPRDLGETPEGEPIQVNIGRFGPYVRFDGRFASLGDEDPHTITRERALELIEEKKEADRRKTIQTFDDSGIRVLHGRYGPYITDGNKNVKVPKGREPESLTEAECRELIANAPERRKRRGQGRRRVANRAG